MLTRSFIDLLFILLCGTIVLLSQSLPIGAMESAPARIAGGGLSDVRLDGTALVAVAEGHLALARPDGDGREFADADALHAALPPGQVVLLVAAEEGIRHHRVMQAWSELHQRGRRVQLGAQPDRPEGGR